MPTPLDNKLLPGLLRLVNKLGAPLSFTLPAAGSYDPISGDTVRAAPSTFTTKATPPGDYRESFADGSSIKAGDLQIGLPAQGLSFLPLLNMLVEIGGEVWTATLIEPLYSGELICFYFVNLHRGP